MGTLDRAFARVLPYVPRTLVERVSARYIAGATLETALQAVQDLNARGICCTVDVLGEFVEDMHEVRAAEEEYTQLLQAFADRGLDTQASIKLTQIGLKLDPQTCLQTMRRLIARTQQLGNLITIDMEDSSCTDATLDVFETLRRESASVGTVLQSCLRRSRADLSRLLALAPNVRICKGIYVEPPEVAYQDPDEVRECFVELVDMLLGSEGFVGIATHDDVLVERCTALVARHAAQSQHYEFQMLLGVREELRRAIVADGHPMRVYVPYGAQWYAYSMRRLKENPAIVGHVLRNLLRT